MLVMASSEDVFQNGKVPSSFFFAWGLDEDTRWCRIDAWAEDAVAMHESFLDMSPNGFGHVGFSSLRHAQHHKGLLKEAMAFRVMPGCKYQILEGFDEDSPQSVAPQAQLNSDFTKSESYSELHRCFLIVKVHEVRDKIEATMGASERLLVSLCDMSGGMRRATIWPPLCNASNLWKENNIVTILGCTVSMKYNSVSLGSGCLATLDDSVMLSQFPEEIQHVVWTTA